eukprot:c35904_g1_i1 orf=109-321(+)
MLSQHLKDLGTFDGNKTLYIIFSTWLRTFCEPKMLVCLELAVSGFVMSSVFLLWLCRVCEPQDLSTEVLV